MLEVKCVGRARTLNGFMYEEAQITASVATESDSENDACVIFTMYSKSTVCLFFLKSL